MRCSVVLGSRPAGAFLMMTERHSWHISGIVPNRWSILDVLRVSTGGPPLLLAVCVDNRAVAQAVKQAATRRSSSWRPWKNLSMAYQPAVVHRPADTP